MTEGSRIDTAYIKLAEDQLHDWALDLDAEPEGEYWDTLCGLAGVDPEVFADMVRYQRRRSARLANADR